jgi:hypothetical protein
MSDSSWLDPGEDILWTGRPDPLRLALRQGRWPFLIGVIFLLFAFMFMQMSWQLDADLKRFSKTIKATDAPFSPMFFVFDYIFLVLGLVGVLAPLWFWFRATRTRYALTNRRAVIDNAGPSARFISVPLQQISFIEHRPGAGGFGHVIFREVLRPGVDGWGPRGDGFIAIPDATQVERLVRTAIADARR